MSQPHQPNHGFQKFITALHKTQPSMRQQGQWNVDDQLIIKRSELIAFAEKIANNSWQKQEKIRQLEAEIKKFQVKEQNSRYQPHGQSYQKCSISQISISPFQSQSKENIEWLTSQIANLTKQKQRLMNLLQSKDQLLLANEQQIQSLLLDKQVLERRVQGLLEEKMNKSSKQIKTIESFDIDFLANDTSNVKQTYLKRKVPIGGQRKISIKAKKNMEMPQQTNIQYICSDLEVTKLKAQISNLLNKSAQLQMKYQMALIQNDHFCRQYELANSRQRALQKIIYCNFYSLREKLPNRTKTKSTSHRYILNNLYNYEENSQEIYNIGNIEPNISVDYRKSQVESVFLPITPHFSCNMFSMFSKKSTFDYVPPNSFQEEIFQNLSQNEQSVGVH